jgi:hypothetical protein
LRNKDFTSREWACRCKESGKSREALRAGFALDLSIRAQDQDPRQVWHRQEAIDRPNVGHKQVQELDLTVSEHFFL